MSIKISKRQLIKIIKEEYEKEKLEEGFFNDIKKALGSALIAIGMSASVSEPPVADSDVTNFEIYLSKNGINPQDPKNFEEGTEEQKEFQKRGREYWERQLNPSTEEPNTEDDLDPELSRLVTAAGKFSVNGDIGNETNLYKEVLRLIKEEYKREKLQEGWIKDKLLPAIAVSLIGATIGASGVAIQKQIDKSTMKKIERQIMNVSRNRQSITVLPNMHDRLLNNPEAFIISDGDKGSKNTIVMSTSDIRDNIEYKTSNIETPEDEAKAEKYMTTIQDLQNQSLISVMPPSLSVAYMVWEDKLEGRKPRFDLEESDIQLAEKGISSAKSGEKQIKINSDKAVEQIRMLYYDNPDKIMTHSRIPVGNQQESNKYIDRVGMPSDAIATNNGIYKPQSFMIDPEFLMQNKDYVLPESGLTVEEQYKLYYLQYLTIEDLESIDQQNEEGSEQFDLAVEIFKKSTGLENLEQKYKSYGDENLPSQEYEDNPNSSLVVKSPLQEMIRKKFFFTV